MLHETMDRLGALTQQALEQLFSQRECGESSVLEACRYSLMAGGKRIRPVLLLHFYQLCGGREEDALPFACGLEMIHTYSLIHDDLPCMDNDDFRRGQLANHKVYGEAMAVLAGDALLNRAFEVMLSQQAVPAERAMAAAGWIAQCAGCFGMIGGQVLDLSMEGKQISGSQLEDMVAKKTGALLRAACEGGVLLAGGTEDQRNAAGRYAQAVGAAFQIQDDILDVTGDQALLGKATGSDAAKEKSTFVSAYGLEVCRDMVQERTLEALEAAKAFPENGFLRELAVYLAQRNR